MEVEKTLCGLQVYTLKIDDLEKVRDILIKAGVADCRRLKEDWEYQSCDGLSLS
jgi:hypothetical protein